jgi:hypothetical protein
MESFMEIFELIVKASTSIVLVIFGFLINRNMASHRSQLTLNVKLIEKRIKIYDEMSPELNDIHQFMTRVGNWKEISPKEILEKKRSVDKVFHKNRPYWSPEFITSYKAYISECFQTNNGTGEDAKIKADTVKYVSLDTWAEKFSAIFTGEKSDKNRIRKKYDDFNNAVSNDFKKT